jgi:hypothetical protein
MLLAGALVLGSWVAGRELATRYDFAYFNLQRLTATPSPSVTIVLIGDSKARCAIQFDDQMSRRLAALGTPARVVRITKPWATIRDFSILFQLLQGAKPTALLVQSELLTLEPNPFRFPGMAQYGDWRRRSRHGLAALLSPDIVARETPENHGVSWTGCGLPLSPATQKLRRDILARTRASTAAERGPFLEVTRQLKSQGVRMALLDLPDRTDAIGRKPPRLVEGQRSAMQQLTATNLFDRFKDPPKLGPEYFYDAGHLNPRGQAVTSAWLASKLSEMLRQNDRR